MTAIVCCGRQPKLVNIFFYKYFILRLNLNKYKHKATLPDSLKNTMGNIIIMLWFFISYFDKKHEGDV